MQHLALDQMVVCPSAAFFNGIGLSPSTISHHMSSLVSAGFIHVDKQNPRSFNLEAARVLLYKENHRQCRWFQKALAMHRKNVLL